MSDSVFRSLFVELSAAAFEIAKGIGEQAVSRARERETLRAPLTETHESRLLRALSAGPGLHYILSRYGWSDFGIEREVLQRRLRVSGRLSCGHWHELKSINETVLYMARRGEMLNDLLDRIDTRVAESPRSCFCTPRAQ